MELIVGTNSYLDVIEADKLITTLSGSDTKLKEIWNKLEAEERENLIYSTTLKYDDCFEYDGRKLDLEQNLQFPRLYIDGKILECPEKIKLCLLIQGLRDYKESNSKMSDLVEQGVTSYKVEGSSITWDRAQSRIVKTSDGVYRDIYKMYFSKYTITI